MQTEIISYKRHRFPPQIIAHVVWLYVRFNLSLREVEEMMLERSVDISYETIRRWSIKFGPRIAHVLRRRQPRPGDVWHLDEVVVKIAGRSFWLWRAVDQHGVLHRSTTSRSAPNPRRISGAAFKNGAAKSGHSVKNVGANFSLSFLVFEASSL